MSAPAACPLDDLGLLCFRGPDARSFLQGQLSNDVSALRAGALLRAGLHTPQGRTVALLALAAGDSEQEIRAVLPRELIATVTSTLSRYVLRSKVTISDESGAHRIYGVAELGPEVLQGYAPERGLIIARATDTPALEPTITREHWRALDIAAGLPQVYCSTSGEFVAQMLNLDCIDAVSFTKGCYTGQEVIARSHYRGRVKRRLQRWVSEQSLELHAGDSGRLADGRPVRVVEAVRHDDGRCEFLAVAPLASAEADTDGAPQGAGADTAALLRARALPLPYPLPA